MMSLRDWRLHIERRDSFVYRDGAAWFRARPEYKPITVKTLMG